MGNTSYHSVDSCASYLNRRRGLPEVIGIESGRLGETRALPMGVGLGFRGRDVPSRLQRTSVAEPIGNGVRVPEEHGGLPFPCDLRGQLTKSSLTLQSDENRLIQFGQFAAPPLIVTDLLPTTAPRVSRQSVD